MSFTSAFHFDAINLGQAKLLGLFVPIAFTVITWISVGVGYVYSHEKRTPRSDEPTWILVLVRVERITL